MSAAPRIGVLALQGDVREHMRSLRELSVDAVGVRTVEQLAEVEGLLIPGGESTTISMLAERTGLLEPLRSAVSNGLPTYGTCAGMILLADRVLDGRVDQQTIGGLDVTVRRNAFGRQVDSFECGLMVDGCGNVPFPAVFIRAPAVEEVGPDVEVLARTGSDAHHADRIVAVRQGNLLATAFHPELTGDVRVHELFVEMVRTR